MAILTISRFDGSLGDEIAASVAKTLGYSLIDKHTIHTMATRFKGDFSSETDVLARENKPGFFDFLFHQRTIYGQMVSAMTYESAARDHCVILGRGGQYLLKNKAHVIHARIVAPFELRVERVMAALTMEKKIAIEYVKASDQKREEFIRYLYKEKVSGPDGYDLIIDTSRFPVERISEFLANELKRIDAEHPMTREDVDTYRKLSLEKRIEIVLMKEMQESNYIKVSCTPEGHVILAGYLATEAENKAVLKHVKAVDGVTEVDNKIIVSQFPVRPWY